jgi:hypothetical protein
MVRELWKNRLIMECSSEGEGIGHKDKPLAAGLGASKRRCEGKDKMIVKTK